MDSISSLVEIKAGEALEGDIEIRYKGKPVENLFSVRAKVRNTGNLAIRKSDILKSITFTFDPNAELLRQPEIVQKKPENLKPLGLSVQPKLWLGPISLALISSY